MTRALRSGGLTNPSARRGSVTFDTWLETAMIDDGRIVATDAVRTPDELRLP